MRASGLVLVIVGLLLSLGACEPRREGASSDPRQLVVAIRTSPASYMIDANGKTAGFEHDLLREFATALGMDLKFLPLPSDLDVYQALRERKVRLAAGWLSLPQDGGGEFRPTLAYARSRPVLVQHEAALPLDTLGELTGRSLHVAAGSQAAAVLYQLRREQPALGIIERPDPDGMELARAVADQRIELAVIEEALFDIAQNYYPDLDAPMHLGKARGIAWLFPIDRDDELYGRAQTFIRDAEANGTLGRLKDRYFGHIDRLNPQTISDFLASSRTVLPRFQALFKQAQVRTGIDWRMLAALAYQESRWDPLATSPTNVRGMMMLTEDTADRLRVGDRLDAKQSILAGAAYLAELREQLPASIGEPDRTWMALAAYNLGLGHLNGARQIARSMNTRVDHWHELKRVLPLMARPEYYRRLKSGRARGGEAVIMVENIRAYYDILRRHLPGYEPLPAHPEVKEGTGPGLRPPAAKISAR